MCSYMDSRVDMPTQPSHSVVRTRRCFLYSLPQLIALSIDRQFLVGVYGQRNAADNIGSISFVIFDEDNGRVEVKGRIFKHLK
jgi:hypothetical protein